jgi:AcrR family transcriptional regulator
MQKLIATEETRSLRQEILTVAKDLFIKKGYHGLAMREISESVGVSKAALYYHFKDKEELFLAILESYLHEMAAGLDQIMAASPVAAERIQSFVEMVLQQPPEQRSLIRLASQDMAQLSLPAQKNFEQLYREKFIGKVETILSEGMKQGEFRRIDPLVATWVLLGMMYPYFYPAHSGRGSLPPKTIAELLTIFLQGISLK